ncbi:SCO3374 family protein [Streptomyces sp. URMC 124]|uniref:SCO3374 family protein n=1 Tax=Streptomyces sp. URMC 124 TaxID=3423405 RepID=UPI003F19BE88
MTVALPCPGGPADPWCQARRWYEHELGWPTSGAAPPLELLTGLRFDVLDLPLDAGSAVLARPVRTGPVALDVRTRRVWFLVAAGSADELPGLLDWLEWSAVPLDLAVRGPGGRIAAPVPVGPGHGRLGPLGPLRPGEPVTPGEPAGPGGPGEPGRAVWVRPPAPGSPGGGVEPSLPVTGLGGDGDAPDLARLVGAAATEVHRARLLRARRARSQAPAEDQPLAFSYASRMSAGTRPRSLTL